MNDKLTHNALYREIKRLKLQSTKLLQAEKAIQRQNEYLTALHETSLALIDKLDKKEILETTLEHASALARTDHAYIYLKKPGDNRIQIRVGKGFFASQIGRRLRRGEGLGGRVWEKGQPVIINDYQHWSGRVEDANLAGLRCIVGIPLVIDQRFRGVIGLGHVNMQRRFDQEDIIILKRFATLALLAIEKAELYADAHRELTDRKKAEALIRKSEQGYRNLLNSSPDPIVVYDMDGVATYVNPAFEQTFGLSREELLGKRIDFVPKSAWPETIAAIKAAKNGKKINLFETQRYTRDGRLLDVQISSTLYFDLDSNPSGNIVTLRDITALKEAKRKLEEHHERLEEMVKSRTMELEKSNRRLKTEVEERSRAEKDLIKRETELEAQSRHLAEVNTALKVLLKQRDNDKKEMEENVLTNIKELVIPYLERLKKKQLTTEQATLVSILQSNFSHIVSPFVSQLSSKQFKLTPMEIRVANLIKIGKTSTEIAGMLYVSKNTILFHRYNIRRKLGIKNTKTNLTSHLLSFDG